MEEQKNTILADKGRSQLIWVPRKCSRCQLKLIGFVQLVPAPAPALIIYDYLTNTDYGESVRSRDIDLDSINRAVKVQLSRRERRLVGITVCVN